MREGGDEKDGEEASARPHWYEYRTGFMGEVGSVLTRTLGGFAIGVLIAAIITIVTAMAVEDRSVSGVLASNGIPDSAIDAITEATDQLARMSFGVLLVLGLIAPGLVALGHCLRDIAVSRAVRQAAASGAPRSSVPIPEHVAGITHQKFHQLWWYLYFGLPFPAFIMILLILTVSAEAPVLSLVCAVFLIAVGLGYRRLHTSVEPQHQRRKLRIGEHWTADDEQAAWDLADKSGAADGQRSAGRGTPPWARDRRVILGRRITYGAIALGCFGCEAMYMLLVLLYPRRIGTPTNQDREPITRRRSNTSSASRSRCSSSCSPWSWSWRSSASCWKLPAAHRSGRASRRSSMTPRLRVRLERPWSNTDSGSRLAWRRDWRSSPPSPWCSGPRPSFSERSTSQTSPGLSRPSPRSGFPQSASPSPELSS